MSDSELSDKRLGPDSSDSPILEVFIKEWEIRHQSFSAYVEELRAQARQRAEREPKPPKENGEPEGR